MFEQFEIVARKPKERTHAFTNRSEPAFVEEYGLEGLYGVSAVNFLLRLLHVPVGLHVMEDLRKPRQ